MMKPTTLDDAIALARLQEGGFNTLLAKVKASSNTKTTVSSTKGYSPNTSPFIPIYKPLTNSSQTPYKPENKVLAIPTKSTNSNAMLPIRKITPAEMQARREKGLCYNCDEPYSFGHR